MISRNQSTLRRWVAATSIILMLLPTVASAQPGLTFKPTTTLNLTLDGQAPTGPISHSSRRTAFGLGAALSGQNTSAIAVTGASGVHPSYRVVDATSAKYFGGDDEHSDYHHGGSDHAMVHLIGLGVGLLVTVILLALE